MDYLINDDKITGQLKGNSVGSLPYFLPATYKCIKCLNIKNKAIDVLDKNIDNYFYNLGIRKGFSPQDYIDTTHNFKFHIAKSNTNNI